LPAAAHGLLDVGVMSYIGAPDLVIVATDSKHLDHSCQESALWRIARSYQTSRDEKIAA